MIFKSKDMHKIHEDWRKMSKSDQELIQEAINMLDRAYAPYSGFHVGSALRTKNGHIYTGCNQENASYPLCMCGERVALYNAGSQESDICVTDLVIVVRHKSKEVKKQAAPCGACRQVISEFEDRGQHPIRILIKADDPSILEFAGIKELLPYSFDSSFL